jgi:hypothetical protein
LTILSSGKDSSDPTALDCAFGHVYSFDSVVWASLVAKRWEQISCVAQLRVD